MDRRGAVVAEVGKVIVIVGGGDGDHAGQIAVGRIVWRDVVIGAAIAGGRDEKDAGVVAGLDGNVQRRTVSAAAPTVVGHTDVDVVHRPHHRGVVNRPNGV